MAWSMSGKTVLITGGNAGLGKQVAIDIARDEAEKIILASRNLKASQEAAEEIRYRSGRQEAFQIDCYQLDLSSLKSVDEFVDQFIRRESHLHVLVNNASVQATRHQLSVDGVEMNFATNHLGCYHLTTRLLPLLEKSAPSRVVVVSSDMYFMSGRLYLDNALKHDKLPFFFFFYAYAQSKLANVLFARELARRTENSNISVFIVKPGIVLDTQLYRDWPRILYWINWIIERPFSSTVEEGASTIVHCASEPGLEKYTGCMFSSRKQVELWSVGKDAEAALKLWNLSEEFVSACHGQKTKTN